MASDTTTGFGTRPLERLSLDGSTLDGVVTALSVVLVGGIVADFRNHAEGISFAEEGFVTVEHAVFYTAFLLIAGTLLVATYQTRRRGATWVSAVPDGYGWAVVGVLVFGFGGVGDFFWHSAFGFEEGIEGLVSPSHLSLAVGATLFLGAPLRSAWLREGRPSGLAFVPVVLSATLMLTIVTMFSAFANPFVRPYPHYGAMRFSIAVLVMFPLVFVAVGLALTRRFRLPPGSLVVLFTVPALAITIPEGHVVLAFAATAAGLVADAIVLLGPPTPENTRSLRAFGALVPATLVTAYFAMVELEYGIARRLIDEGLRTWSVHVLTGTVVLAAAAGVLLTYFAVPGMTGSRQYDDGDRGGDDDHDHETEPFVEGESP